MFSNRFHQDTMLFLIFIPEIPRLSWENTEITVVIKTMIAPPLCWLSHQCSYFSLPVVQPLFVFDSLLDKRTVDYCCFCSLVIIIDDSVSIAFTFCMTSNDTLFTNKTLFGVRRQLFTLDFSSSEEI